MSLSENPLISVIIRTCRRPLVLKEALNSLRQQTFKDFEVVIIEDGPNSAESLVKTEFKDLSIVYAAFGENRGRSKAGNYGLSLARGQYVNFLDDDDLFLPNHLELLINSIQERKEFRIAYSMAYQVPTKIKSINPYEYVEKKPIIFKQAFNRALLYQSNYIPIQCIMFERNIYIENGGFDETMDYFEDWDMWIRYSLENDFLFVSHITSKYRVPYEKGEKSKRLAKFDEAMEEIRIKQKSYQVATSPYSIAQDVSNLYEGFAFKITYNKLNTLPSFVRRTIFAMVKLVNIALRRNWG